MPITALYAAILAALFIALSARVIVWRRSRGVEIGDGEDRELLRRMRVHANCAEYAPIALITLGLAESLDAPAFALHAIGLTMTAGRLVHAYALSQTPHVLALRVLGMVLTFVAIAAAALLGLILALPALF